MILLNTFSETYAKKGRLYKSVMVFMLILHSNHQKKIENRAGLMGVHSMPAPQVPSSTLR